MRAPSLGAGDWQVEVDGHLETAECLPDGDLALETTIGRRRIVIYPG